MQSEAVKEIIDIENEILAEHEHLRQELDLRLQQLKEEGTLTLQRRREQLQQQRLESLEGIRGKVEKKAEALRKEAQELADRLDALDDDRLKRCIAAHLNLLLPGDDNDRQDGQS
ncbi:MAG: hypothetical protein P8130_08060 [Deltaproteobacteria bacterium]